jgi:monofunctional biosynthetic peptidoglycan transglycosylase
LRRSRPRRVRLWRFLAWATLALALGVVLVQGWFLGHVVYWKHVNPGATRFMESRLEALRAKDRRARLAHHWIPYSRISVHLKRAIIAAEDAKFVDHEGFDWEGIQRALDKNQRRGKVVAGGSTITQQLAKNLFLSGERSFVRKGQEAVIAAMLEVVMDKRRIFELYVNVVEWGESVFGAEAAARHYYGLSASDLGPEQAARLAAMLPRPRYYERNRQSEYLARYAGTILARMAQVQVP